MSFLANRVAPYWRNVALVATPLLLLPIVTSAPNDPRNTCAYVVLLMAVYWMTEALPVAVTSLLPVVLFPLFGIMSTETACVQYLKETNMMFIGGLIMAIAVEHCGLHTRIALKVLLIVGTSPKRIMIGFMLITMFLSMWISNTATTAMMMPIAEAVLQELFRADTEMHDVQPTSNDDKKRKGIFTVPTSETMLYDSSEGLAENGATTNQYDRQHPNGSTPNGKSLATVTPAAPSLQDSRAEELGETSAERDKKLFRKTVTLSVAYASNIGGTGTLSGTGPNLVLKGMLNQLYGSQTGLNFATWMFFSVPTMLVCVVGAWCWLYFLYTCKRSGTTKRDNSIFVKQLIKQKYKELGTISFHELAVLFFFIVLILLWFFRKPMFIGGWAELFPLAEIDDASAAILISILLFATPSKINFWCFRSGSLSRNEKETPVPSLLEWNIIHKKMPWGVVLLLGGGFSMAEATKLSKLSDWVGEQLIPLEALPSPAITFVVCLITAAATEVTSNVATATVLLPVLANLAQSIRINPLYVMLPATITCSYAFMLPIATPSNAIAFTAGKMKSKDMLIPGIMMNVMCVVIITMMINTLGVWIFDLNSYPSWAAANATASVVAPNITA